MEMLVYVSTTANTQAKILVYAFLDSISDHSYNTKDLAKKTEAMKAWKKIV